MHPWLVFLKESGKRLSDIEYLAIKEFGGKLVYNDNTLTAAGDLATLTASSGKDMYLAFAQVNVSITTAGTRTITVTLNVDTVVQDTVFFTLLSGSGSEGDGWKSYKFPIGFKVAATKVIKLEVTAQDSGITSYGEIQCIEETTGESPAV